MSKLSWRRTVERIRRFATASREKGAFVFAAIVALMLFAFAMVFKSGVEWVKASLALNDLGAGLIMLFFGASALCLYVVFNGKRFFVAEPTFPSPEQLNGAGEALRCVVISSIDILDVTQKQLTPRIFGGATPANDVVYESFKSNNRRSIAIFSDDEQAYVGFASFWPITELAASRMLSGNLRETDLLVGDLLPKEDNQRAKHALIPAIAVMDAPTPRGVARALKLMRSFRRFIAHEFLAEPGRSITIIATAYSSDGERWCRALKMRNVAMSRADDGTVHPIYSGILDASTLAEVSELIEG